VAAGIQKNERCFAVPKKILASVILAYLWMLSPAQAFNDFKIEDIRVEGLQRIAAGTVFNYLPLKVGDHFSTRASQQALQALFKTGFFNDVKLARRDNILIVQVVERPAIAKISFDGNKSIQTEQLNDALKAMGVAEGRVFDRSLLDKIKLELQRQYFSQGRYAAQLETTVTPLERNRVQIHFDIAEGEVAKIRRINIIGNQAFKNKTLLAQFELSATTVFSFFSSRDQYSRQKLAGDLESLRSYYLDRGFIHFNIESTQVAITPDRQNIYITINISEGKQYTVEKINITGNLIVPEAELRQVIQLKSGELFSGKDVSASNEALAERIGDDGYAFANVNAVPEIIPDSDKVIVNFFIDPGKRVYVRRIDFGGNTRTRDEVLRREMRQMEGGLASTRNIKRSRTRLERLGYFEEVNIETKPVPGVSDQVDIQYTIIERPSGNLMAGIGYGQTQGVMFNASISQDNFLGSGKKVALAFNNSQVNTIYSFAYTDPYFTIDGLSQGFELYYKTTDAEEANLSRYLMDSYGFNLNYGLPISEFNSIYMGFEPQHIELKTTEYSPREVHEFINQNGNSFNIFKITGSWAHDTRNRALFPNQGTLKSFNTEVALPGGDLSYYKLSYRHRWYLPLSRHYTLLLKGEVAYGEGYSDNDYPFFENYTAGGPRTVRGFKENTLGPEDSDGNPLGGNLKTVANIEMIFPPPFAETSKSVRLSTFLDIGNVYGVYDDFDAAQLRYAAGLGIVWYSPLGGLTFSLARPLNKKDGDDTQFFQFSIGSTF
jgi:outer membrane protein insertion porin family